ncbi:hypothetical protein AVEN_248079-1 [Araneus ventricosus]|uniref:Uncharacterized protein n=1 Tax=Araneus ventricosus TaxID=182803 RepID=A0A4Y2MPK6_ARAVE|nr:hypothetical protein AVEN_248079-1 [Araneus ventricosus]
MSTWMKSRQISKRSLMVRASYGRGWAVSGNGHWDSGLNTRVIAATPRDDFALGLGIAPFRCSKSDAACDSQRKCQNGYCAADGSSLVPRKQLNCNSSKTVSVRVSK